MVKMMAVNGVKVEAGSCTVAFRVSSRFGDQELGESGKEITHGALYRMLDQADEVVDMKDGRLAVIQVGKFIEIDVWEIDRRSI